MNLQTGNIQQQAQKCFDELGWPHRRLEGWQWSDFSQQIKNQSGQIAAIESKIPQIDGIKHTEQMPEHLPQNIDALTAFNIAHGGRQAAIIIPANARRDEPIHIHHHAGLTQMQIIIGAHAHAIIHEHFSGDGFSHLLTEITLEPHARLEHIRVFDQPATAISAARLNIDIQADAEWNAAIIASGAKLQRIDHHVRLAGEGARARCRAALLAAAHAHCDIGMTANHPMPNGQSSTIMRAVLASAAQGSFRPSAHIAEGAQNSDVHQSAKTLLLSDQARMNAKPQLNIYNDNVQCAHGVAIGALDPAAVFYLRSRAISESEAHRILIAAFISDLFADFPSANAVAQARLDRLI